jgi:protein-disulfide isomerase
MKINKIFATIALLFILAVAILGLRWLSWTLFPPTGGVQIEAKTKGDPKAPIQIIEYTDFQCPACSKGDLKVKSYLERFGPKIYLEYRHYPLEEMHKFALRAAVYAECASGQNKFWPMHDLLFFRQGLWKQSENIENDFKVMAVEADLDLTQLAACVADPKTEKKIRQEKEQGQFLGVQATPTYFLNGKMVVGSGVLADELDKELKKTTHEKN